MVFSSVPVYLDPPHWQQQANHQWPGGSTENSQFQAPQPLPTMGGGGGGTGSIRPNSMAERARLAKIPQPEAPLKCPRCDSTNTKFCYFNNYSLSQPRHFCKTCRRYWTRGGTMRNVPVGGGCRRNKRSKRSNRSKSPAVTNGQAAGSGYSSAPSSTRCTSDIIGHLPTPQLQIPLVPTLHQLSDYNSGDIGLNFGGIRDQCVASTVGASNGNQIGFQGDSAGSIGAGSIFSSGFVEQWKLQQVQQFPFLSTGLEQATGLYSFESEGVEPQSDIGQPRSKTLDSGVTTQLSTVKMEEIQALSLSRNFLGISGNDQYWSSNAWTDISGFTSPSTSHLL